MIETKRLVIRPFTADDSEDLLAVWSDQANERFIGGTPPESIDELRAWIERGMPWGVWERETGELVGDCGLFFVEGHCAWERAYGFRRDRWGRGYATEAARACVRHGFDELGLNKIVADVDPANIASVRVLENCGFVPVCGEGAKLVYAVTR